MGRHLYLFYHTLNLVLLNIGLLWKICWNSFAIFIVISLRINRLMLFAQTYRVFFNSCTLRSTQVIFGVPQRNHLGPLIFNLLITLTSSYITLLISLSVYVLTYSSYTFDVNIIKCHLIRKKHSTNILFVVLIALMMISISWMLFRT